MNYKIYQNIYHKEKYFIFFYRRTGGVNDYIHGMIIAKDKNNQEWYLIPCVVLDADTFDKEYQGTNKDINLENIIITHVLGVLDII